MKDLRTLCDEAIQLWDADCDMEGVINEMRTALAQPEPDAASSMTQSEQQAVIGWVDQHINTNKAIRSWRDPTRGGLLMAEVHTVQPGARARWGCPAIKPVPEQPSQSAFTPSVTNCHLIGPAPSPYGSWSEWFETEGSKGVIHGIRMEALPFRSSAQQGDC